MKMSTFGKAFLVISGIGLIAALFGILDLRLLVKAICSELFKQACWLSVVSAAWYFFLYIPHPFIAFLVSPVFMVVYGIGLFFISG